MNKEAEKKPTIGVLLGGMSSEKEVSLNSGRNIFQHIPQKYARRAVYLDGKARFWEIPLPLLVQNKCQDIESRLEKEAERVYYEDLPKKVDFMFIALHGKYGEDGCVQGVLDLLDVPYSNSDVLGSAIGMNKYVQKKLLDVYGINDIKIKERLIYRREFDKDPEDIISRVEGEFSYPFIVKPNREGSSSGVSKVNHRDDFIKAFNEAFKYDNEVFVEEFLKGLEFSCIVIEDKNGNVRSLLPTEIVTPHEIFTYEDKYLPGASQKITPARVPTDVLERIKEKTVKTHQVLGFRGYSRIDGFLINGNKIIITDPNSSSTMAPSSFLLHQAAEEGMTAGMFIDLMIENGLKYQVTN